MPLVEQQRDQSYDEPHENSTAEQVPAENSAEMPAQIPVEMSVERPVEMLVEMPKERPAEIPANIPKTNAFKPPKNSTKDQKIPSYLQYDIPKEHGHRIVSNQDQKQDNKESKDQLVNDRRGKQHGQGRMFNSLQQAEQASENDRGFKEEHKQEGLPLRDPKTRADDKGQTQT